ncbi:MAG: site-specific DNA-methyltransferase [Deltaproteobacteria bacterium]|nr:site-specific DNA-methyltransferase [Deltaproteobacteria bacterium]
MPPTQTETRFIELMTELFQLDEAEALDFGLYRIIRRQNREIRDFIGEVVTENGRKVLQGGRLSALLAETFTAADDETTADDTYRIAELEKGLGIKPGMNLPEREALLASLEKIPATAQMVADYRSRLENRAAAKTATNDQAEVLNRLYQFFSRHYQDGDFIVERRYGRDGSRYIRSTGEDTEFHWATEDMYYIKSGDIFTDFPVKLVRGQRLLFTVEAESLQKTRAELKPSDKAHYELDAVTQSEDGIFKVSLKYLKGAQSDKQKDEIALVAQKVSGGDSAEIKRWLTHFIARNQSDFFIHKRLKEALIEDLDIFIKTEVLDADQLLADGDLPRRVTKVARIVRRVGQQIIDFLAVLEDFQKALWEKKKLVFTTRYVITLDRIERLAGREWLETHLERIVELQREEWRSLGLGDFATAAACRVEIPGDLLTLARVRYLPLPVDTGNFDEEFKWALLEAVSRNNNLDEALDGVAIHSDNWQALNTMQARYREQVKCCYIDPPYNTGGDGFPYKDAYPHASWLTMIIDRLAISHKLLSRKGAIFVSIDAVERNTLTQALDRTYGTKNRVEEIIWVQNTTKNQSPTYSTNHEYVEVYACDLDAAKADVDMFREPKPGAAELLDLVETINPDYPSIAAIEFQIKKLFDKHRAEFRAELEEKGIDYNESLDPWKGLFNSKYAEYRTEDGIYVAESEARIKGAIIRVWQSDNSSMPQVKGDSQKECFRDPEDPAFRFYRPLHEKTGLPCPPPKRGWAWPYNPMKGQTSSFSVLAADKRIVWGDTEKNVPRVKRYLHEVDTQVSKSVVLDYTDGEKELTNQTGKTRSFPSPKPTTLISRFIAQTTTQQEWVLDFFAGSGTTYQATLAAGHDDRKARKIALIEAGKHFETILISRVKRCSAAWHWKNGKPEKLDGPGLFMRVQALEQYEDTLENLDIESPGDSLTLPFDDPAWRLRYRLEQASRALYCGVDCFNSPFGYTLKRVEGGGDAPERPVDLVESLVYLLGLEVSRMLREPQGVVVTGRDRRQQTVAVFFRDCQTHPHPNPPPRGEGTCTEPGKGDLSVEWLKAKLAEYPADRVLTNDPASLTFEGCDRFEAIETVFAGQFGRV